MTISLDKITYSQLLVEYQPKIITTEAEYDQALETVEKLIANKQRTPEQTAILQLLVTLIEEFENKHYPLEPSSPHAMLEHLMDARGIKQSDLVGIIGSKGVVSEVVNRKRAISKAQAKALGELFNVSPALFI
ncbi:MULTISPECIES: type II toxin-antitoxin system HigA family antitoxin [Sphaerospermopsis]|jgi:HTH-type transcriptional regulator/antitoxin HigA|uniref:Transcriptional regulator n=1 Tax=Sphaerospermopsis torques-reginae ITEP-024 TaxID=984208 RepID=A0ABX8X0I1_9CYAN|nr:MULTISPECIES: transcriptional regulator [Sphaerospermopsis]MBE9055097.1 transcriptional regulator [Sphaerospermopsis sp. LEGE 08334]QYX32140.1 transcriptional regulator [Sphaerospermopsis torques-reginae ITEP-024]